MTFLMLLAQIGPNDAGAWFKTLAGFFGIPGTLLLVLLYAIHKGWLITGREIASYEKRLSEKDTDYDALTKERDARLKEKDDAFESLKQESEHRLEQLRIERDKNFDLMLRSTGIAERIAETIEKTHTQRRGAGDAK